LKLLRIPVRVLLFAGIPLGLLVGRYCDELWSETSGDYQRTRWLSGGILLTIVGLYWWASHRVAGPTYDYWLVTVIVAGLLAGVCFLPRSWATANFARVLVVGALLGDLWGLHWKFVETKPLAEIFPEHDVIRVLNADKSQFRVFDYPPPPGHLFQCSVNQGLSFVNGIERVLGENPTQLHQYSQFLQFVASADQHKIAMDYPVLGQLHNPRMLDLLRVKYLIVPAQPLPAGIPPEDWRHLGDYTNTQVHCFAPGYNGIQNVGAFSVFQRTKELPQAWLIPEIRSAGKTSADLHQQLLKTNLLQTAFFEFPDGQESASPSQAATQDGKQPDVQVARENPDEVVVEVSQPYTGGLVLSDVYYPGWTCVDEQGKELPVYQANGLFRGVQLSGSEQQLTFRFEPKSFRYGSWISLGTLFGLTLGGVVTLASSRRQETPKIVM
ncbi:MAG: hypothetical protein KDA84_25590, partial [Planctomycetaceae bacterium]|nr:hypothetical protein [Planctomycetaceae bacterium]